MLCFIFSLYLHVEACVGRILTIGIVETVNENLLAELISVLINERTGTTVNVKVFDGRKEIYDALKKDEISIIIETTDYAMSMLDKSVTEDKAMDYDVSKKEFREKLSLIWLKPFGLLSGQNINSPHLYSPVITEDVLINFPALPRVINKLKDISKDKRFDKVMKSVKSGKKTRRAARDYLRKKKLI